MVLQVPTLGVVQYEGGDLGGQGPLRTEIHPLRPEA